ncbi:MAG: polysaccharide biosynthesis/export family protein [Planctomycetota bacterium]
MRHAMVCSIRVSLLLPAATVVLLGCEVDNYLDPSRTGRFEMEPTTISILDRIDVVEGAERPWGETSAATPEDLLPSDLTYRFVPGDVVTIEVFGLLAEGEWTSSTRRIDAGGFLRVRSLGDIRAAGRTQQELEDEIVQQLAERVMFEPQVNLVLEEGGAFHYVVYGAVPAPGLFTLRSPDFRLLDALAVAGGAPPATGSIYVIRQIALTEEIKPPYQRGPGDAAVEPPVTPAPAPPPVDIESLLEQLEAGDDAVRPGMLPQEGEPVVDIDELEPVRMPELQRTEDGDRVPVDIDQINGAAAPLEPEPPQSGDTFIFVEERDEWLRVRAQPEVTAEPGAPPPRQLVTQRVIEIPYEQLSRGESYYNIVIRPNDRIYVTAPEAGFVYIDGEIVRPGVYNLPNVGRLTLSRLVAAAGGLGPLAIPERVDLTRIVAQDREATIRLDLAAIRQRTEPDLYLKPDDHVIIGTSWLAPWLAVIRNGFRATYGFGFLLDRNFGNDVFGPPPVNVLNR